MVDVVVILLNWPFQSQNDIVMLYLHLGMSGSANNLAQPFRCHAKPACQQKFVPTYHADTVHLKDNILCRRRRRLRYYNSHANATYQGTDNFRLRSVDWKGIYEHDTYSYSSPDFLFIGEVSYA